LPAWNGPTSVTSPRDFTVTTARFRPRARSNSTEGPCKTFPYGAEDEIRAALGDFLEKFLAEAANP